MRPCAVREKVAPATHTPKNIAPGACRPVGTGGWGGSASAHQQSPAHPISPMPLRSPGGRQWATRCWAECPCSHKHCAACASPHPRPARCAKCATSSRRAVGRAPLGRAGWWQSGAALSGAPASKRARSPKRGEGRRRRGGVWRVRAREGARARATGSHRQFFLVRKTPGYTLPYPVAA